jgi:hypothetical protein
MNKKFVLDPLWITKGSSLDPEYFNYILLAATVKYKKELEALNIDRFDELFFHILNLNNLMVNKTLLSPKFKKIVKGERLKSIKENLSTLYKLDPATAEIFKNANYVFLNLLFDYMSIQMQVLDTVDIFYSNNEIHKEKEIFVLTSRVKNTECTIWKFAEDLTKNFGYSYTKIAKVNIDKSSKESVQNSIFGLNHPELGQLKIENVVFISLDEGVGERLTAKVVKDVILLNKGIAKEMKFEPTIISELYQILWFDKHLPYTLEQWVHA